MKQAVITKTNSLVCGSLLLLGQTLAQAQSTKPLPKWPKAITVVGDTSQRVPEIRKALAQPARTSAYRNGPCDILTNGDFEIQTNNLGPTRINNLGGSFGTPDAANQTNANAPIPTELDGWTSPTGGSPDYYASNARTSPGLVQANIVPATGIYATFPPFSPQGSVGLGTLQPFDGYGRISEYIQTGIPTLGQGRYYAQLQVRPSNGGTLAATGGANASTRGVGRGFGLQVSNGTFPGATNGMRDFLTPTNNPQGVPITGVLTSAATTLDDIDDVANWRRISGQFDVTGTEGFNVLTVGMFDSSPAALIPLPDLVATTIQRTYILVDNVELFRIPTAGLNTTCGNSIGEGCPIPGATYSWSPSAGLNSTTTLNPTASPAVTTTYTLTVTLPDNSTFSSSTTVTACPPPPCPVPPRPLITLLDPNPCYTRQVSYEITNRDPAYTYTITAVGGAALPGIIAAANPAVAPGTTYPYPFRIKTGTPSNYSARFTVTAKYTCNTVEYSSSSSGTAYFSYCIEDPTPAPTTSLSAYPNPASEVLSLPTGATDAVLLNSQGKAVQQSNGSKRLDVSSLPAGLYNLQIKQDGKLINQHIEVKH
jgi:hypothetical protein